jgi:hypothetical protein
MIQVNLSGNTDPGQAAPAMKTSPQGMRACLAAMPNSRGAHHGDTWRNRTSAIAARLSEGTRRLSLR